MIACVLELSKSARTGLMTKVPCRPAVVYKRASGRGNRRCAAVYGSRKILAVYSATSVVVGYDCVSRRDLPVAWYKPLSSGSIGGMRYCDREDRAF